MPVETTTNIPGLNQAYPLATDGLGEGDDHLRLIKRVIKNTFPMIDKPLTVSSDQINSVISNPFPFPVGGIILWSGTTSNVPTGWALCDGRTVNRSDGSGTIVTPNLTGRFILGAGLGTTPNTTGGSTTHTHTAVAAGVALTIDQLPPHTHGVIDNGHTHGINDPGHAHGFNMGQFGVAGGQVMPTADDGPVSNFYATNINGTNISVLNSFSGVSLQTTGQGNQHSHTVSVSSADTTPPYYALCYIMKI